MIIFVNIGHLDVNFTLFLQAALNPSYYSRKSLWAVSFSFSSLVEMYSRYEFAACFVVLSAGFHWSADWHTRELLRWAAPLILGRFNYSLACAFWSSVMKQNLKERHRTADYIHVSCSPAMRGIWASVLLHSGSGSHVCTQPGSISSISHD